MMSRGEDAWRCRAHGDRHLAWCPVVRARHRNGLMAAHWAAPNGLPQIPGRMIHPAMMRRPDRQLVAWSARCGKHIVDVHFPICHGDRRDVGRDGLLGGCLRRQPALALLVRRFPLPPPLPVACVAGSRTYTA